ncbi:MAG: hypothetical protein IPG93_02555 [Burkholderiales bacterium]|nr:hypothetical protein [Burkholderiales bacterium]
MSVNTATAPSPGINAGTLTCPYCTSAISTAALVCPVCTRDLYLFKPLLEQSRALGRRLDDALARIADLEARPVQVVTSPAVAAADNPAPAVAAAADKKSSRAARAPRKQAVTLWRAALALALVLVAAHTVIVVAFDLPAIWLRLVCVVMPIPFGYWMAGPRRKPVVPLIVAAVLVATIVPLLMSTIVAALDHTSILPSDPRELQEFISFALSIGLSLGTGMLLGRSMGQVDKSTFEEASRTYGRVSNFVRRFSPELVRQNFESWQKALLALVAVCTTAASMVSGLKDVVGSSNNTPPTSTGKASVSQPAAIEKAANLTEAAPAPLPLLSNDESGATPNKP